MLPNLSQTRQFLDTLAPDGKFTFQTFPDAEHGPGARVLHGSPDDCSEQLSQLNDAGHGVFVTVNQTDLIGRKAKNVIGVRAVFVDLDGPPLEPVLAGPLAPSIIVQTSPGKWHVYWLTRDLQLSKFTPFQKLLIARFNGDKAVHDLPRVMRLPGFLHQKVEPFLSCLEKCDPTLVYSHEQIVAAFGAPDAASPKKVSRTFTFEEGSRNNDLISLAGSLKRRGLSADMRLAMLQGANSKLANPLPDEEIADIAHSISRYDAALTESFTDQKLADGFARIAEGKIVRIAEGGWATYADGCWQQDPSGRAGLKCQELVKSFVAQLETWANSEAKRMEGEDGDDLKRLAKKCQSKSAIDHIKELAASDSRLLVPLSKFDAMPGVLNLKNGCLDLTMRQLLPHDPQHFFMRQAAVAFDPDAKCPQFDQFLSEILEPGSAEFLMLAFAYSLLGTAEQQLMFILIGSGLNGKTTLANVIRRVLGDYAVVMDPNSLTKKDGPSIGNDIARLHNARAVFTSEFAAGARIDAALTKRLTGRETVTARYLFREHFEFTPKGVFFLTTNHSPVIDGGDKGLRRRMCVVPFEQRISPDKIDPQLEEKLFQEGPGILNRLLAALSLYDPKNFSFPPKVRAATDKYLNGSDIVGGFLRECCEEEQGQRIGASLLHKTYQFYCHSMGLQPLSMPSFKRVMEEQKGYIHKRETNGIVWMDLRLRAPSLEDFLEHSSTLVGGDIKAARATVTGSAAH